MIVTIALIVQMIMLLVQLRCVHLYMLEKQAIQIIYASKDWQKLQAEYLATGDFKRVLSVAKWSFESFYPGLKEKANKK